MISHLVSLALVFALTDAVTTSREGEPPPATHQVRKERMNTTQTLVYPNELASSVQPYTACLVDQLNAQFRQLDGASQEQMPEVRAKVLAACANTRAAAMGSGVKALEQTSIPDTQRSSYVESIITDLESALLNPKPPSFPAGPEVK